MEPGYPLDKNMEELCRRKYVFPVPYGIVAPKICQNQAASPKKIIYLQDRHPPRKKVPRIALGRVYKKIGGEFGSSPRLCQNGVIVLFKWFCEKEQVI